MRDRAIDLWGRWRPSPTLDLSCHEMIEHKGKLAGCMATRTEPDALCLSRLYIAPDDRNAGIGAVCLDVVIARARALGRPITLRVLTNNPAWRFYERHGFEIVARNQTHIQMTHKGGAP